MGGARSGGRGSSGSYGLTAAVRRELGHPLPEVPMEGSGGDKGGAVVTRVGLASRTLGCFQ